MADSLPTVWPAKRHTLAKHEILERYLQAWFPILSNRSAEFANRFPLYIDGFAGPGVYSKGEPGSPIIAIRAARNHSFRFPTPIKVLLVESDQERFARLVESLAAEGSKGVQPQNVEEVDPLSLGAKNPPSLSA
jgi:three-Cys-motif partner protein